MIALKNSWLSFVLAIMIMPTLAGAETFSISPTNIRVPAPGQTGALTVKSGGPGVMQGQVRVFRSTKARGTEQLTPTRDVVASPPALRLAPNQEATIRLVRRSKKSVRGEECYRVLVDQLPRRNQNEAVVSFTIRHSIPLCFTGS